MIRMLLDSSEFGKHDISSWKGILYGASPMAEALLTEALKRLPSVAFTQGYGQTELAPLATLLGPEWHVFEGPRAGKLREQRAHRARLRLRAGMPLVCAPPAHAVVLLGDIGEVEKVREGTRHRQEFRVRQAGQE